MEDAKVETDADRRARLSWKKATRSVTIEQKVMTTEVRFSEGEVEQLIKTHLINAYGLNWSDYEIKVSLLDIERSNDAALAEITKVQS